MGSSKLLATVGVAVIAIAGSVGPALATDRLYDRLGGQAFIECWIDASLAVIARDKRIDDFFTGDLNAGQRLDLRDSLVQFACAATGGNCMYEGRDMVCAHVGLGIGHSDFEAFIEDLERGARHCGKREPAYSELGKVLRSLRPPIVQDDLAESEAARERCSPA
jgi:hemoglobin